MFCINRELVSILTLSISFMLLFAADFTMTNMQKIFVNSIANERPDFDIDGYTVNGLVYSVFAISLWFGPYVTYSLGPRLTMFLSAVSYLGYVGSYATEKEWVIYTGAVIGGIGAGMLWPAQGQYMIENSSPKTTARNAGIFLFLYMISYTTCSNLAQTWIGWKLASIACLLFVTDFFVYPASYGTVGGISVDAVVHHASGDER